MEDKKKLTSSDSENQERPPGWSGVFWLSAFLVLQAGALCSVTLWQQTKLDLYSDRILRASRVLDELEENCGIIRDEHLTNGSAFANTVFSEHQRPVRDSANGREKRQTLHDLFNDLLLAQEQVLKEVCIRRTDLCKEGPKGVKGDQGDQGVVGAVGLKGDTGAVGPVGDQGPAGPKGVTGKQGPPGPQGVQGDAGTKGMEGLRGDPGDRGLAGDTGPKGADGAVGATGDKGDKGEPGIRGPTGLAGDTGPKGVTGNAGPRGLRGDPGTPGTKGPLVEQGCLCYELPVVTGNFSDTVTVRLHHKLVLHCDVSDSSSTITWRRADGHQIPNDVTVSGNDLIFNSAGPEDDGMWECVASSVTGNVIKSVEVVIQEPSKNDCDFESGTFCQWNNVRRDDTFDWTIIKGPTATANTGPTRDHTRGDPDGFYAFIETSSPRLKNDNAQLESPALAPSKPYCLDFWYHMYGQSLGNLNVRIRSNGLLGNPIWQMTGPSQDFWHEAKIDIPPQSTPFSLVIEGVRGDNYYGDLAIDDVALTESACS